MKENNNFTESFRSKFESIKNGSINRIAIEAQQLMNGESIDEVKPTALDEYNDLLKGMDNNKSISKEELSQLSSYQIKNFSDNPLSPEELKEERKKNIEDVRKGLYNKKKNTLKQINKDIAELQETIREKINIKLNMNTDQNTNTDQSVRETRRAKFEKLGIPTPQSNIPNARLDFFEKAGIPIPKEKSFYTEQNYGVRNPKILENIKNIKAGDQKKFFDQFLKFSNSKNFGDGIYQKVKHELVPNPTKYDDNGDIPKTPYPTLDDFTATPIPSTNDIERLFDDTDSPYDNLKMPSRSELYSHLDQISHKPGMISRPIAINKDDFETRPILTEAKRAELFKYYGTYYEKKYDALLKKEQDKLQKEEQEVIINTPLSKVDHFKTVCIEKYNSIKLWINNAKQTVVNYINSIPKKWADWKLRMILSKEQRDLLAALPQALAPKHNEEETENVPDQFKKITQKRNTFDYFKMRDLNERVQQIPE